MSRAHHIEILRLMRVVFSTRLGPNAVITLIVIVERVAKWRAEIARAHKVHLLLTIDNI